MKLQVLAVSFALLAVLLTSSLATVPSVHGQQSSSLNTTLTGVLTLVGPYSFDLCKIITFNLASCALSFVVADIYKQNVTLQIVDSPSELQIDGTATTGVGLSSDLPVQTLDLNFTYGGTVYSFPVPIPSFPVPGAIPVQIPLTDYLAIIPVVGGIISNIASLNLDLNFTSQIQGVLASKGFTPTDQQLTWNTPSTDTFTSAFAVATNDASLSISELDAISSLKASLVLKLPLLGSYNLLPPINLLSLQIGSSNTLLPLGDWYRLSVQSAYSQTSGSGWYLSGSQASFAVTDTTSPGQNGNYQFTGWTGTGTGSYSGTQQTETLTATGPANETANWNFVPNSPSIFPVANFGPAAWTIGIGLLVIAISVVIVVLAVVITRRPKPTFP